MIKPADTTQTTYAKPEAIFAVWADINHWADVDKGIEWAKLTDTFAVGSHYDLERPASMALGQHSRQESTANQLA